MAELKKQNLEEIFDTTFKDSGSDWFACCPVHNEKTPSFYVGKENFLVHCFGCGASGHIVKFIEDYKGVDREEAEKLLGITSEDEFDRYFNPEKARCLIDPVSYPESWLAPFKKEIHKYVIKRGFRISTLEQAETLYDASTKRQVFPHRNREQRLVGAIGRACREQEPKWYYYWGYEKARYLYTTDAFRRASSPGSAIWIVEGVFDALWCYQHGMDAAAILGSKASKSQIQEIVDNYDTVVLALDNDEVGIQGSDYLYKQLEGQVEVLFPIWPEWGIDIMNVNPHKLELVNLVQWHLVQPSVRCSRVLN